MTDTVLTERLAEQVLHWVVATDRFLTGNRTWLKKWKFNPCQRIADAFRLLDAAAPTRYTISLSRGRFEVEVEIQGRVGRASGDSKARSIALAVSRSLGLEV